MCGASMHCAIIISESPQWMDQHSELGVIFINLDLTSICKFYKFSGGFFIFVNWIKTKIHLLF